MTLILPTEAVVYVSAWKLTEETLHLQVGTSTTVLTKAEAEKLQAYLEQFIGAKVP